MRKEQIGGSRMNYAMLERTVQWVGEVTNTASVSAEALQPALCFLMIWAMFERANSQVRITNTTLINLCESEQFPASSVEYIFSFFKKTYFPDGVESVRFKKLLLKKDEDWVKDIFVSNNSNHIKILKASMMIIYRFRNNFAHGVKNQLKINIYWKEFSYINDFLKSYLTHKLVQPDIA